MMTAYLWPVSSMPQCDACLHWTGDSLHLRQAKLGHRCMNGPSPACMPITFATSIDSPGCRPSGKELTSLQARSSMAQMACTPLRGMSVRERLQCSLQILQVRDNAYFILQGARFALCSALLSQMMPKHELCFLMELLSGVACAAPSQCCMQTAMTIWKVWRRWSWRACMTGRPSSIPSTQLSALWWLETCGSQHCAHAVHVQCASCCAACSGSLCWWLLTKNRDVCLQQALLP